MALWIALGIGGFFLLIFVVMYNGLVGKKNQVENAESSIDIMLRKRGDLIPQLVDTAKVFMTHERELLEGIVKLRSQIQDAPKGSSERMGLENQLSGMLGKFMVNVENYPELKSNEHFLMLQRSINEVEEQLSASRRSFNASVTDYNNAIEMFPSNIVAGMLRYEKKEWFELPPNFDTEPHDIGNLFNK